jgi:hypothetical protein
MSSTRAALLRNALLAIVVPVSACGGDTPSTGAASSGAAGAAGAGGQSAFASPAVCVDPRPLVVMGIDTGFDQCAANEWRRRAVVTCPGALPAHTDGSCSAPTAIGCHHDADCGTNGYCSQLGVDPCKCTYFCLTDADCGAGAICLCGPSYGTCQPAYDCTSDADCNGGLCASVRQGCQQPFLCTRQGDACAGSHDCPSSGGPECLLPEGASPPVARTCGYFTGACGTGRPLEIADVVRVARAVRRGDWG